MTARAVAILAVAACLCCAVPGFAADGTPRDADQIFATTCGWCHSKGGREPGKGPRLMGTTLSDAEIVSRIRKGKVGYMPPFEGTFSDAEIKGLVAYIRNLKP
jgi:mono/diheme cytochrome c family protein